LAILSVFAFFLSLSLFKILSQLLSHEASRHLELRTIFRQTRRFYNNRQLALNAAVWNSYGLNANANDWTVLILVTQLNVQFGNTVRHF
jgi:hypothetical protein